MLTSTHTRIVDQEPQYVGDWMHAQGAARYREGATCIGCERDGQLVAGAMFDYCNGASIFAHIAVTGRFTKDWLWFICYYPFVQLGCQVVIGLLSSVNTKAILFDENFGFRQQCRIPNADTDGDLLIYALQKDDCRFLTRRPHGK